MDEIFFCFEVNVTLKISGVKILIVLYITMIILLLLLFLNSSEIGYAGSPPREMLARGCSIDSVDRPFQPSDWVDVNLEVPNTPRASSAMTNRTLDTTIYHTTTPSSSSE